MGAANRELARWLVAQRAEIERVMQARLGPAAPGAGAPESEVLRRFRSFAGSAHSRGGAATPALDGLRVHERRGAALLLAWAEAARQVAGEQGDALGGALEPLILHFRTALRSTHASRRGRGAPRSARRAVLAAIDRVADSFLAVDADSGRIVDANPAAGALLGVARDALLGVEAIAFVESSDHTGWWTQIDAMAEGAEPRRFQASLQDASGTPIPVDCSVTRFTTRERTLALIVARPA